LQYALDDVVYLEPLYDKIQEQLVALGRASWLGDEMSDWQAEI
jgi:ribonuclease D